VSVARISTYGSGIAFRKQMQFSFRDDKFRVPAIQADHQLGENPDDWLVKTLKSRKMDGKFSVELI
jgi:hypothetical protein